MKLLIVENDDWLKALDTQITLAITNNELDLLKIAEDTWNYLLVQEVKETKQTIFENLSTKKKIKWINAELTSLLNQQRQIKISKDPYFIKEMQVQRLEEEKKALNKLKMKLNPPQFLPQGTIGNIEIDRAKQIPMDQIIDFNKRGYRNCLWHDDKNPSMKWFKKNNKVKCFACGQVGDTVDVVMKLYNLALPQAVKRILSM